MVHDTVFEALEVPLHQLEVDSEKMLDGFAGTDGVAVQVASPKDPARLHFSVGLSGLPPVPVDTLNFGPVRESIVGMDVIGQHVTTVGPGSVVQVGVQVAADAGAKSLPASASGDGGARCCATM